MPSYACSKLIVMGCLVAPNPVCYFFWANRHATPDRWLYYKPLVNDFDVHVEASSLSYGSCTTRSFIPPAFRILLTRSSIRISSSSASTSRLFLSLSCSTRTTRSPMSRTLYTDPQDACRRPGADEPRTTNLGVRVELSGKVALVTGSSRGIGREISRVLAQKGARVAVHYRSDREAARETLSSLSGGPHAVFGADVADADSARGLVEGVARDGRDRRPRQQRGR